MRFGAFWQLIFQVSAVTIVGRFQIMFALTRLISLQRLMTRKPQINLLLFIDMRYKTNSPSDYMLACFGTIRFFYRRLLVSVVPVGTSTTYILPSFWYLVFFFLRPNFSLEFLEDFYSCCSGKPVL